MYVADHVAGAKYLELPGRNVYHFVEPGWASSRCGRRSSRPAGRPRGGDGAGGPAQAGKQQRAARGGDIGLPGRSGQDQRPISQLLVAPPPECLHQMLASIR